jgi:ATP-binding cassette subfamily B (MDR/TAP) protein 11
VVVANGQEEREMGIYNKFLVQAKNAGTKIHIRGASAQAFILFVIIGGYSYALFTGYLFVRYKVMNTYYNPNIVYTPGDILSCFWGVMFGMFSVGMASPNLKAISEGRAAGKAAFDIIERVPRIP